MISDHTFRVPIKVISGRTPKRIGGAGARRTVDIRVEMDQDELDRLMGRASSTVTTVEWERPMGR